MGRPLLKPKNFREVKTKCCGSCYFLNADEMTGAILCTREDPEAVDLGVHFDPGDGEEWRYVCDRWKNFIIPF